MRHWRMRRRTPDGCAGGPGQERRFPSLSPLAGRGCPNGAGEGSERSELLCASGSRQNKSSSLRSLPLLCPSGIFSPQAGRRIHVPPRTPRVLPSGRLLFGHLLPASGEKNSRSPSSALRAPSPRKRGEEFTFPLTPQGCFLRGVCPSGIFPPQAGRRIQPRRGSAAKLSPCGTPSGPKRRSAKTIASAPTRTMVLQRVP